MPPLATLAALALLTPAVAHAQLAGPDSFGYTAETTAYDFVTLGSVSGASQASLAVDDAEYTIALPFTFPWYGVDYTSVRVADNGGLFLGTTGNLT